ncbi:MAG: PASTA domain-containing protein [Bacteroidales bacterium]|nr:PASTA domain-containing protein [Bacteroidales bacterium]
MASKAKETKNTSSLMSNWIVRNLVWAGIFITVLIIGAMIFLNVFTKHNNEISVPDFANLSVQEARELAAQAGMRVEVSDSVFVKRMEKGAVYRQNPRAGSKVKEGRRILLTINAVNSKKVTMPNLIGYSMRQAMAELQSRGLVLGRLIYVQDIATNNVLRQLKGNREIEPGVLIESESVIDLVVGLNSSDRETYVPDLIGLKNISAQDAVHAHSLNIKRMRFDDSVKDYGDSLNAMVYKQSPEPSEEPVPMGEEVTLYLTVKKERVPVKESSHE